MVGVAVVFFSNECEIIELILVVNEHDCRVSLLKTVQVPLENDESFGLFNSKPIESVTSAVCGYLIHPEK